MSHRRFTLGPGALVAAAFIGPGTVTACTIAGSRFGFALLWALLFATLATIALQEMAARLGVITGRGLGAVLVETLPGAILRRAAIVLVLAALYVGNSAYEAGNLAGAVLGVQALTGDALSPRLIVLPIALLAAGLLWFGHYRLLEKFLVALVLVMCAAFLVTALIVRPDPAAVLAGLRPQIPPGSLPTVLALIGTTVVPYNLFLHASAASRRWQGSEALGAARTDTIVSVGLGGLISMLIVTTAAASLFSAGLSVDNAGDMARQLEPAFGSAALALVAVGLFAAGLSSALTAPLATAYAVCECLGWPAQLEERRFKAIALSVLIIGATIGSLGLKPIAVILFAQVANGLLLPVIAVFLLAAMNRPALLGQHVNTWRANTVGAAVTAVALFLGARLIVRALT